VGELRDLKGIFVLIEALAGVTRPDGTGANLVMAGDGAERGALESQIAALGLGDRVTLLGAQPARPSFAKGKIAVVPSLAESLPYVVLEAGAARLPVIASDVGGIPEIFGSQKDKLVPADDVTALRAAMQATLNNPNESAACAEKLSSFIAANFSAAKMSGKIETLYSQSLRGT
jgi:glycosyltransferase involved in cell wall biosynthesis